jgi:hypothetical protein
MAKMLVVGDATVDQMYFVDALPGAGGEMTALRALMEPGGAGGTMATALARLGHDVTIATRVGTGPFSSSPCATCSPAASTPRWSSATSAPDQQRHDPDHAGHAAHHDQRGRRLALPRLRTARLRARAARATRWS